MNTTLPRHAPVALQSRGDLVESVHYGSAVALSPTGEVLYSIGDPDALFYPRSALKPLFAAGMLDAGAHLTREQLALAAASHSGAARHRDIALSTLATAGLDATDLANSLDLPYGPAERADFLAAGGTPTRLAQNCSGKHAALVALCVTRGWPVEGYLEPGHPVAALLADAVAALTGAMPEVASTDGCGTPVYGLTLTALATAFSNLATAPGGTGARAVADAMSAHPELVAGEGRNVTAFMRAVPGSIAKDGFEGIQAAALADGTAVAVKVSDGGDRARMPVATAALLRAVGDSDLASALDPLTRVSVLGGGEHVGWLEAAF